MLSNPKNIPNQHQFESSTKLDECLIYQKNLSGRYDRGHVRITLNRRLAIAAAAIVQSMIKRRRPRVLRPVSPFIKGSIELIAPVDDIANMIKARITANNETASCSLQQEIRVALPLKYMY